MTHVDPGLATSTISDALDRLGIAGQTMGLRPQGSARRLWGPAFTVRMAPAAVVSGSVGDYIDDVPPGSIIVIDNDGRRDVTVWGDILTMTAVSRGIGGTVINGVCRDSHRLTREPYPLFSLGVHMRTGKDRVQLEAVGDVVALGDVRVAPGDLVVGDDDGVVVIPASHVDDVLNAAREIEAAEDQIRAAVQAGERLDVARKRFSYHSLQSKRQ